MSKLRIVAVAAALVAVSSIAWAAGLFNGLPIVGSASYCDGQIVAGVPGTAAVCAVTVPAGPPVLTGAEIVPADTLLPNGVAPQTVAIPVQLLANFSGMPRNYLDNGSLNIQQRGTGTVTCAQNAGLTTAAYGPDRWGCSANVAVGAGRTAIVTTAALLPAGFAQVNTVFRTSGALTQPVCSMQEIPSVESTALAGKTVTLSFFAAALAGLAADNNNVITASIFTGTGSDQGLGTMTASPAITPAWTGLASPVSQSPITITTTPTRYSVTGAIPATATEVGVAICFTPTATGAGATDGFAYVGAQLEVAPAPTAYEFHTVQFDLSKAQRYFTILTEPASGVIVPVVGNSTSATAAAMTYSYPAVMRAAPTFTALGTALGATTWTNKCGNVNNVLATTFIVTATANTVSGASLTVTSSGSTIGFGCVLVGAGGGSILSWSADF